MDDEPGTVGGEWEKQTHQQICVVVAADGDRDDSHVEACYKSSATAEALSVVSYRTHQEEEDMGRSWLSRNALTAGNAVLSMTGHRRSQLQYINRATLHSASTLHPISESHPRCLCLPWHRIPCPLSNGYQLGLAQTYYPFRQQP
jgi:hypothetical protein